MGVRLFVGGDAPAPVRKQKDMEDRRYDFFDNRARVDVCRNRLTHWQQGTALQYVSFRLAGTLPLSKLKEVEALKAYYYELFPQPWSGEIRASLSLATERTIHDYLDECRLNCLFNDTALRDIVERVLRDGDESRYQLFDYVIMPNHVHLIMSPNDGVKLSDIMRGIKSFSAHLINKYTGRKGSVWQADYFDRAIRNEAQMWYVEDYIRRNPRNIEAGRFTLRSLL